MDEKQKQFKIVAIIDDETVIINAGKRDGIMNNDKFNILDSKSQELKDPDTDEILGIFKQVKQPIFAKDVQEKYSICVSRYKSQGNSALASMILGTSRGAGTSNSEREIGKKMKIQPEEATESLTHYTYETVHVGDVVEHV